MTGQASFSLRLPRVSPTVRPSGRRRATAMFDTAAPRRYSTMWSARNANDGGIVRPRVLAVPLLIANSNVVGCSTGRSPGFAPFKILSTYTAARLHNSGTFGPYDMRPPAATYARAG